MSHKFYDTIPTFPSDGVITYTFKSELESNEIDYNIVTIIPPASVMDVKLSNNQAALATRYFIILPIVYNNADF